MFTACRVAYLRFLTYAYNETEKTVINYYLLKNFLFKNYVPPQKKTMGHGSVVSSVDNDRHPAP